MAVGWCETLFVLTTQRAEPASSVGKPGHHNPIIVANSRAHVREAYKLDRLSLLEFEGRMITIQGRAFLLRNYFRAVINSQIWTLRLACRLARSYQMSSYGTVCEPNLLGHHEEQSRPRPTMLYAHSLRGFRIVP